MVSCKCGHLNEDGSRFCSECGNSLVIKCSYCQAEIPHSANFCQNCGKSTANIPNEINPLQNGSIVAGDVHTTIIYNQESRHPHRPSPPPLPFVVTPAEKDLLQKRKT